MNRNIEGVRNINSHRKASELQKYQGEANLEAQDCDRLGVEIKSGMKPRNTNLVVVRAIPFAQALVMFQRRKGLRSSLEIIRHVNKHYGQVLE